MARPTNSDAAATTAAERPAKRREPALPPEAVCEVIYADEHLVVVDKRAGFPVSPVSQYQERSVLRVVAKLGYGACFPVNLLDREATGLVLLSRDAATAKTLRWNWRSSVCERRYIAVAAGDITGAKGRITLPLGTVQSGSVRRRGVLPQEQGGRAAETRWKLLARGRGMSRLLVTLRSGRCHQIRIHFAAIGLPLVNERVYVERNAETPMDALLEGFVERKRDLKHLPAQQIGLHFWQVTLPHPATGHIVTFTAPIPRTLMDLMPGAWVIAEP